MKKLLAVFCVLSSVSSFGAERKCTNLLGHQVCADITKVGADVAITNISPDVQKSRSVARQLCSAAGNEVADYKIKIETKKSCNYLGTKGFFADEMVSACNDFGGLSRGTVFSKIRCLNH